MRDGSNSFVSDQVSHTYSNATRKTAESCELTNWCVVFYRDVDNHAGSIIDTALWFDVVRVRALHRNHQTEVCKVRLHKASEVEILEC